MTHVAARALSGTIAACSGLFLVDLFLDWGRVAVGVPMMGVSVAHSGWSGWGIVAGGLAIALLLYALLELGGYIGPEPGTEIAPAALAIGLVLTALARFQELDQVHVGGSLGGVFVDRRWPAAAGLALASVAAVVAVGRLVLGRTGLHGGRVSPTS